MKLKHGNAAWMVKALDDSVPNEEQRQALCELMESAFVVIRFLCWDGKSKQAADLADVFHNLPREMYGVGKWSLVEFRRSLQTYQKRYQHPGRDFVEQLDLAFGIAPYDDPDARIFRNQTEMIAEITRWIEDDSTCVAGWYVTRAELYMRTGAYAQAIDDLNAAVEDAHVPMAWRDIAWIRAACPDYALRDGPAAVTAGRKYLETMGSSCTDALEVLAAAHAACDDHDTAARYQQMAVDSLPKDVYLEALTTQLARYRAGEGYVPHEFSWWTRVSKKRDGEPREDGARDRRARGVDKGSQST